MLSYHSVQGNGKAFVCSAWLLLLRCFLFGTDCQAATHSRLSRLRPHMQLAQSGPSCNPVASDVIFTRRSCLFLLHFILITLELVNCWGFFVFVFLKLHSLYCSFIFPPPLKRSVNATSSTCTSSSSALRFTKSRIEAKNPRCCFFCWCRKWLSSKKKMLHQQH